MTFVRRYMGPENKLFHERIMIKTLPPISSMFQNVTGIWGFDDKLVCGPDI